ncbi:MAG: fluoride efflux transporter CrcB [Burkholderiales bacterium]|nr:fluoride efflux transporter CrcB [Burkholderiales bacterium]
MYAVIAVATGAALGALLRWALGLAFNPVFPTIPMGTLASNLIGGYLVGVAVSYFGANASLAPEWRLFAITGFLGGLTTFSTFSAEVVGLMRSGQLAWALAEAAVHMLGSFVMTAAGMYTIYLLSRR